MPESGLLRPASRRWGVIVRAVLVLLVGAILTATALAAVGFKDRATRSLRTELALNQASLYVNSYRYYGQSFANGARLSQVELKQQALLARTASQLVARLADQTSFGRPLVALNSRLEGLMAREVQLVQAHRSRSAEALDAKSIAPVFGALIAMMATDQQKLDQQSTAASADASSGILASVLGAGVLLILVLAAFERSRRRQLRVLAETSARRRNQERFAALVRHATDVVVVVDVDGTVTFETPPTAHILGYGADRLLGRDLAEVVHPADRPLLRQLCQERGHERALLRIRRADGEHRYFEVHSTRLLDHPEIRGIILNGRDVTEQRRLEEELRHQALHDPLTGLANRTLFNDRVEHALARHLRTGDDLAVLLIDLDNFKSVNDVFGHGTGDKLLFEVADRLSRAVRGGDTVARLGGDEFAILLDAPLASGEPQAIAERVHEAISVSVDLGTRVQAARASIGIAAARESTTAEELLRDADLAMYVAKQQGKGRSITFEVGMHLEAQRQHTLTSELAKALEAGDQLTLHYQPIVRLDMEEAIGVEALVRWKHPIHGLLPPQSFIPLAEESGLIVELGRWVLEEATRQLAEWAARDPHLSTLTVSVNASARQLEEPDFVEDVRSALAASGLSPEALVIEITESVIMGQASMVLDRLVELRALGVRIAIDDFGTGYSSLAYLRCLPADFVKIDRSFTMDLSADGRPLALAEAIVHIGATLQLETVAEGVEETVQMEHLKSMHCEYGQGYLFAKPLPADDCLDLLRSRRGIALTNREVLSP